MALAVAALEKRAGVRKDALRTLPTRRHPGVHHPHRPLEEEATDSFAVSFLHVAVGGQRQGYLWADSTDADIGMSMPDVVRPGESTRWFRCQRDVHHACDA